MFDNDTAYLMAEKLKSGLEAAERKVEGSPRRSLTWSEPIGFQRHLVEGAEESEQVAKAA
jgi:hypothetical protein